MNFTDAITHTKNHYVPEEIATDIVLGVTYDSDNGIYPACTLSFDFIPARTRNANSKHDCNEAGEVVDGYSAYLSCFNLPDDGMSIENGEVFTANSPDELLAQLPAFASTLNYQVYTPHPDADLIVELNPLLRDLFPDLPDENDDGYAQAAIAAMNKYNSGVLPTGITTQDITSYFEDRPASSLAEAFEYVLSEFEVFASAVDMQMLGVFTAPKNSAIDVYIASLVVTPAEYRDDLPFTTDTNGNVCNEYQLYLQGGAYGKPATITASFSANSVEELIAVLPKMLGHVKYRPYTMSEGHRRHNTEAAVRKMFPSLLAGKPNLSDDFEGESEEALASLAATAFEVISKSNF